MYKVGRFDRMRLKMGTRVFGLHNIIVSIEVFANNTNLTFLYKIDIEGFAKEYKIKLPPVGIELTTDHHWFRSQMLL